MTTFVGGCSCGQFKYELTREPIVTHACHCTLCQRYSASAFIVHSMIEKSNVVITHGILSETVGPSKRGKGHTIKRCPTCGDQIYSQFEGLNGIVVLKTTTLNEPSTFPPQAHIYVRSKLPWVELSGIIPVFEEFYSRKEVYTHEALKRSNLLKSQ